MNESEDALLEREAKRLGKTVTQLRMEMATPDAVVRDIVGDARRGLSQSQSLIASRPEPTPTRKSDRGWVEQKSLQSPPGIALIDAMCEAQDVRDRAKR